MTHNVFGGTLNLALSILDVSVMHNLLVHYINTLRSTFVGNIRKHVCMLLYRLVKTDIVSSAAMSTVVIIP